jgi:hypothetical protein
MVRERLGKTKEACQHIFENFALMMSQWRRTVSSSSRWTLGVRPRPRVAFGRHSVTAMGRRIALQKLSHAVRIFACRARRTR